MTSTVGSVATGVRPTQIETLIKHQDYILQIYRRNASMGCLSQTAKQHTSKCSDNTDTQSKSVEVASMEYISKSLCSST